MAVKFIKDGTRSFFEIAPGIMASRDVDASISSSMSCRVCEFEEMTLEWTVVYDEYIYVLEGVLTIETKEGEFTMQPNDGIWLPKNTWLVYKAAKKARALVAVFPANWRELEGADT